MVGRMPVHLISTYGTVSKSITHQSQTYSQIINPNKSHKDMPRCAGGLPRLSELLERRGLGLHHLCLRRDRDLRAAAHRDGEHHGDHVVLPGAGQLTVKATAVVGFVPLIRFKDVKSLI